MRRRTALALAAALALLAPGAARACSLELILALDVSGSIDGAEFTLQTDGLAAALEHARLAAAVEALPGGMLLTVTHWSGVSRQSQMIPWRKVNTAAELDAAAHEIRTAGRAWRNFSTAIGEALQHARAVSEAAPEDCDRKVVDVSGDGVSNEGRAPGAVSAQLAAEGYTINGLVIRGAQPDPLEQYMHEVIAGPGAFVEVAESFEDYPRAILRKLLREIDQPLMISSNP